MYMYNVKVNLCELDFIVVFDIKLKYEEKTILNPLLFTRKNEFMIKYNQSLVWSSFLLCRSISYTCFSAKAFRLIVLLLSERILNAKKENPNLIILVHMLNLKHVDSKDKNHIF